MVIGITSAQNYSAGGGMPSLLTLLAGGLPGLQAPDDNRRAAKAEGEKPAEEPAKVAPTGAPKDPKDEKESFAVGPLSRDAAKMLITSMIPMV